MIDNVLNGLKRTGEEAEDTGDKIDGMGKKPKEQQELLLN